MFIRLNGLILGKQIHCPYIGPHVWCGVQSREALDRHIRRIISQSEPGERSGGEIARFPQELRLNLFFVAAANPGPGNYWKSEHECDPECVRDGHERGNAQRGDALCPQPIQCCGSEDQQTDPSNPLCFLPIEGESPAASPKIHPEEAGKPDGSKNADEEPCGMHSVTKVKRRDLDGGKCLANVQRLSGRRSRNKPLRACPVRRMRHEGKVGVDQK